MDIGLYRRTVGPLVALAISKIVAVVGHSGGAMFSPWGWGLTKWVEYVTFVNRFT